MANCQVLITQTAISAPRLPSASLFPAQSGVIAPHKCRSLPGALCVPLKNSGCRLHGRVTRSCPSAPCLRRNDLFDFMRPAECRNFPGLGRASGRSCSPHNSSCAFCLLSRKWTSAVYNKVRGHQKSVRTECLAHSRDV